MPEPGGGGERVVAEKRRGEIDDSLSLSLLINSVSIHTHVFTSQFKKRIAKDKLAGFGIEKTFVQILAAHVRCCGGEPAPSPARSRAAGSANTAKRGEYTM